MTQRDDGGGRGLLIPVLKVVAVVGLVAVVVWRIPLASDEIPETSPPAVGAAPTTTTPEPLRLSPGALDDAVPMPDGMHATAATWDGAWLWVVAADDRPTEGAPAAAEARILAIDLETGEIPVDTVVDGSPSLIAADADAVWVVQEAAETITRLDPADGAALATLTLPADAGAVTDIALNSGSAVVATEGGGILRIGGGGDLRQAADPAAEPPGRIVSEAGEVWVLSRSGEGSAALIDPVDVSSVSVPFDAIDHPVVLAAFADGEMFVSGATGSGSTVTLVDRSSLEPVEQWEATARVTLLGWVAGTFGALDDDGVFLRLRPTGLGDDPLRTNWDGEAELFPVDRETWMLADDGATLGRVLIVGPAT